jgi:hypothetical protein
VQQARQAKTDQEFYDIVLEQMARLKDTHTRIISYPGQPRLASPPVMLNKVEGKVAVIRADPVTTLTAGDIIVSVEDRAVDECLAQQIKRVCNSTERGRCARRVASYSAGRQDDRDRSAEDANGLVGVWYYAVTPSRILARSRDFCAPIRRLSRLHSIARWTDGTIPEQFDQALKHLSRPGVSSLMSGAIRGNDQLADVVNGRLITNPVVSSIDFWRKTGTDQYDRTIGWVQPRGPWTYQGRVAVLIDEASMSACEHFVSGIEAMGRVLLVGMPTNGAGGGPTVIKLPDGTRVAISRALGLRANGVVFEGHGIPPHIYSAPTLNDLRKGRDPAMDAAKEWIGSGKDLPARIQPLDQQRSRRGETDSPFAQTGSA